MEQADTIMELTTHVYDILNTTAIFTGSVNATYMDNNFTNITSNVTEAIDTDTAYLALQNIIYNYLGPMICVFGMMSNIINLMVLTQNELPESPYTHLTGLACTDFTALFLSFIYMMFSSTSNAYGWKFYDAYIFIGCVNVCVTSSIMITVQLTIERFLFVRYPLWAKDTCDRASAKVKIILTIAGCTVFNIPRFLCFEPTELNGTYYLGSTEFRKSDIFYGINWMYGICVHFIPLFILSCTNAYLVYAVNAAGQKREKFNIRNNKEEVWQREQRRLTITLISIVFLFIICVIPSAFCDRPIAYAVFGGSKTEAEFVRSSFYYSLQYISNLLVWCELSLNFVLYCAFNEKFRRVMFYTGRRFTNRIRCIKKRTPGSVALDVQFRKYGHSMTRSSIINNSNSVASNSRCSVTTQEGHNMLQKAFEAKEDCPDNLKVPLVNDSA